MGFLVEREKVKAFHSSPTDAHPVPSARVRCSYLCLFFALSQRIGEEKTLKGLMPLRNPQDLPLSLSFGGYQKALWHLQFLRQRIKDPPPIASRLSFSALFRAALQGERREKHKSLFCNSRHTFTTRGRRRKKKFFLSR